MIPRYSLGFGVCLLLVLLSFVYRQLSSPKIVSSYSSDTAFENPGIRHLGVIMDGNRRWAKRRGYPAYLGHKYGVEPVKTVIQCCLDYKIPYLTLYAFSLENFKRSHAELNYLFDILANEIFEKELESLIKEKVKVSFIGDASKFPEQLRTMIEDVELKTAQNTALNIDILFCYGGQQEIVNAAKKLAQKVHSGQLDLDSIAQSDFEECLWAGKTPEPDLIIRSGGDRRLSNFLTYKAAYSELYFIDSFWPDLKREHFQQAFKEYGQRKRNFGA